jgi:dipeptidyl aminopeptidase/acylaminoacyl peptidase
MNRHDSFERELTVWFADVAAPRVPDYLNDIVQATAGRRQRPRWTFLERWLPMTLVTLHPVPTKRFPWRTVGLLAVIAALIVSLVIVGIGSRERRSAEPFGLASNGPVAYTPGFDIWVVDPATGLRRAVVTGPERDHDPRWSPDGTRIAFLRDDSGVQHAVIVAADGQGPAVVSSRSLGVADPDAFKWGPDSQTLVASTDYSGSRALLQIDAGTGAVTNLPVDFVELEAFWRPPDGRQLAFVTGSTTAYRTVSVYSLDTGLLARVPIDVTENEELRPMGWTPDGSRLLVGRWMPDGTAHTFVIDPDTGAAVDLPVGYGRVSNAGDRVVGVREGVDEAFCIIDIDGGTCVGHGEGWAQPGGPHFTTLWWSPDDRYIVLQPLDGDRPFLFDSTTGEQVTDADWIVPGADSWRRDAP